VKSQRWHVFHNCIVLSPCINFKCLTSSFTHSTSGPCFRQLKVWHGQTWRHCMKGDAKLQHCVSLNNHVFYWIIVLSLSIWYTYLFYFFHFFFYCTLNKWPTFTLTDSVKTETSNMMPTWRQKWCIGTYPPPPLSYRHKQHKSELPREKPYSADWDRISLNSVRHLSC
jgi:hypothetical protein